MLPSCTAQAHPPFRIYAMSRAMPIINSQHPRNLAWEHVSFPMSLDLIPETHQVNSAAGRVLQIAVAHNVSRHDTISKACMVVVCMLFCRLLQPVTYCGPSLFKWVSVGIFVLFSLLHLRPVFVAMWGSNALLTSASLLLALRS